jgi:uncharacterized membrane protein YecN with MAPEG domain
MLTITPIYVAAAVAMYSVIAFVVISNRIRRRISIGDAGQTDFARMVRGHGNFAEYAPITLLAIGVADLAGAPASILHACGILLLCGRGLHAYCFLFTPVGRRIRVTGMMLTFFSLWIAAGAGLFQVLS